MTEREQDAGANTSVFGNNKPKLGKVEETRLTFLQDVERANAAHDLVALVGEKVRLARSGDKWRGLCPFHGDQRLSTFTVDPRTNRYACSVCGAEGDALSWIMHEQGLNFHQVVSLSLKRPCIEPHMGKETVRAIIRHAESPASDEAMRQHQLEMSRKIWDECHPITHTLGERFFYAHGIVRDGLLPDSLRFHPHLYHEPSRTYYPAVVAVARKPDGTFHGIFRTYLSENGLSVAPVTKGRPHRMYGGCFGGFVLLHVGGSGNIAIAETIESALSVAQACPDLTVLASMALNNFKAPVPEGTPEIIICADSKHESPHMAERVLLEAAHEHGQRGHRVLIARAPQGMTINDLLLAG